MKLKKNLLMLSMTVLISLAFLPFSYGADEDFISVSPVEKEDAGKALEAGAVDKGVVKAEEPAATAVPVKKEEPAAETPSSGDRVEKVLTLDLKDKIEVRIITTNQVKYKATELAAPPNPRILVQLSDCGVKGETTSVNKGGVSKVRSAPHGTTAWVVVDLKSKQKWDITQDGSKISVNIPKSGGAEEASSAGGEEQAASRQPGSPDQ